MILQSIWYLHFLRFQGNIILPKKYKFYLSKWRINFSRAETPGGYFSHRHSWPISKAAIAEGSSSRADRTRLSGASSKINFAPTGLVGSCRQRDRASCGRITRLPSPPPPFQTKPSFAYTFCKITARGLHPRTSHSLVLRFFALTDIPSPAKGKLRHARVSLKRGS